ncbi:MAG: hypothetical protein ACFFDT_39820 [Candidatus Hodarchaeota archaeon]
MSEVRGQEGFEGPTERELEDYIKQSRKSVSRMQRGRSPLFFRPKKNRTRLIIGIVFLFIIPTALLSIASLMSTHPSENNHGNFTGTTDTYITELTFETTTPIPEELDLEQVTRNLENIIDEMITPNHSIIHPEMIDGLINSSHLISDSEVLDLIWYLSQFESSSKWWIIGKELLFERFTLWNESYAYGEAANLQVKALRSYLVYKPVDIPLNMNNLEIFNNACKFLWDKIQPNIDKLSMTLGFPAENSTRLASDQILLFEFLSQAINFPTIFDISILTNYAQKAVETIAEITSNTNGIPEYFDINSSHSSTIFRCRHQGELILALHQLDSAYQIGSLVNLLINRINKFITNHLRSKDWSCSEYCNSSNRERSKSIFASDQSLIIRCNVLLEYLQNGKYISGELIEELEAPNSGFYSSSIDQNSQYLLDQVQILLAFNDLILLESIIFPTESKEGSASWGFGLFYIILSVSFILVKRKWRKRTVYSPE